MRLHTRPLLLFVSFPVVKPFRGLDGKLKGVCVTEVIVLGLLGVSGPGVSDACLLWRGTGLILVIMPLAVLFVDILMIELLETRPFEVLFFSHS